jgi:hypothetical protein
VPSRPSSPTLAVALLRGPALTFLGCGRPVRESPRRRRGDQVGAPRPAVSSPSSQADPRTTRHHHRRTADQRHPGRRTTEGLSKKEIIRCLKRYVVREVYTALLADYTAPHHLRSIGASGWRFSVEDRQQGHQGVQEGRYSADEDR